MPGLSSLPCADCVNLSAMPGIHVFGVVSKKGVDGRDKPGHDENCESYGAGTVIGLPLSTICTVNSFSVLSPTTL